MRQVGPLAVQGQKDVFIYERLRLDSIARIRRRVGGHHQADGHLSIARARPRKRGWDGHS